MKGRKKVIAICCLFLAGLLGLCGCSSPSSDSAKDRISDELVYESSMELEYAKQFSVDYYKDGYRLLATSDGTKILVIPEGKEAPKDLEKGIIVMQQPVQNLYLVSSSVMDIFDHLDALDSIRFSSQKEEDWYIEGAKKAMARGDISYAGKYSKPDYEQIVSQKCTLAIENMMISHTPEVREMLEDFGIPVMIYNSTIDGGVSSIEELLDKCEVLKDFKAVKNGDVWCTTNDMYQQSMSMGYLMQDIHSMLLGENEQKMKYLFQLK